MHLSSQRKVAYFRVHAFLFLGSDDASVKSRFLTCLRAISAFMSAFDCVSIPETETAGVDIPVGKSGNSCFKHA